MDRLRVLARAPGGGASVRDQQRDADRAVVAEAGRNMIGPAPTSSEHAHCRPNAGLHRRRQPKPGSTTARSRRSSPPGHRARTRCSHARHGRRTEDQGRGPRQGQERRISRDHVLRRRRRPGLPARLLWKRRQGQSDQGRAERVERHSRPHRRAIQGRQCSMRQRRGIRDGEPRITHRAGRSGSARLREWRGRRVRFRGAPAATSRRESHPIGPRDEPGGLRRGLRSVAAHRPGLGGRRPSPTRPDAPISE